MGVGLRPRAKALEVPPNPNVRALDFYPDKTLRSSLALRASVWLRLRRIVLRRAKGDGFGYSF
jgi:hypothetical protein